MVRTWPGRSWVVVAAVVVAVAVVGGVVVVVSGRSAALVAGRGRGDRGTWVRSCRSTAIRKDPVDGNIEIDCC